MPFTVEIASIAGLDETSLSPDPFFDHVLVFYYFSTSPTMLRVAGATRDKTGTYLIFEPEVPHALDVSITVVACSSNVNETDFFPVLAAPSVTIPLLKDTGNPSGADTLQVLTSIDDATIPLGCVAFQYNKETTNGNTISSVGVWLHSVLPAEGPYKAERDEHPSCVIETGTCVVEAGNKVITATPDVDMGDAVLGRVMVIFTNDAFPDSDMDYETISARYGTTITVNIPFVKAATFSYVVLKRWWDFATSDESTNLAYWSFTKDQMIEIGATRWRTPTVVCPLGTFYATLANHNVFGAGTRLFSSEFTVVSTPGSGGVDTVIPGAMRNLSIVGSIGHFIISFDWPLTGVNTVDDLAISIATAPDFSDEDIYTGYGPIRYYDSFDPSKSYYFRLALHNQSGEASHVNTAGIGATGWSDWNVFGAPDLVSSGAYSPSGQPADPVLPTVVFDTTPAENEVGVIVDGGDGRFLLELNYE